MQPFGGKLPQPPVREAQRGASAEGGRPQAGYVHKTTASSSVHVFKGTTQDGERIERRRKRIKLLFDLRDSLEACGRTREAKALFCCGEHFHVGRCADGGHRLEPIPCNLMICAACASRRSKPIQRRVLSRCRQRGKRYWFLTLTVPNIPTLTREFLDGFIEDFARLRASNVWEQVKQEKGEWVGITGGVYSLECVFSKQRGDWHPHIHALVELPKGHPDTWLHALKAEWLRITGNGKYLHFTPVYGVSKRGKKLHRRVNRRSLKELVKYVTKAADFADQPERVNEFLTAFKDVRRVQAFGSMLGAAKEPEHESGDDHGMLSCSCGGEHLHSDFAWSSVPISISETMLMPDGSRQLKFDFARLKADSQDESPPDLVLELQEVSPHHQQGIEFAGPLPALSVSRPQLFAAGN